MSENRYRRALRSLVADRYYILTEIGTGGMGTVYRGTDRYTGQAVAVKLLHPHLRRDPVYVARFQREADLALRLDSRHVVQILNYGVDNGEPYIVMEFIEGQNLSELLLHGPLAPAAAAHIGVQIARALEEAHRKGVIHRDIKPRNVMIRPDGVIKVADFGIARADDSDTGTETNQIGAAAYMAPERFSPRFGPVDARTDLYSLGVVLYEMLAGYPPFSGDTYELIHQILDVSPAPLDGLRPDIDADLVQLIDTCLSKQTSDRPPTATAVREALEPLADASQLQVGRANRRAVLAPVRLLGRAISLPARVLRPRNAAPRSTRPASPLPKLLLGALALIALAALIGAGVLLLTDSGQEQPNQALAPGPAVTPTIAAPVTTGVRCIDGSSTPLAQARTRCPGATVTYSAACPVGQACGSSTDAAGAQVIAANDATVALVDESGTLIIARTDGSMVQRLTNRGQIEQPAWSPDGRYLAYISAQLVQPGDTTQDALYATQLRIIEAQNPANDWVAVSSTERVGTEETQRRLINWPRWAADGKSLLFLWPAAQDVGDDIFQVELPFQDKALDATKLVKEAPPGDSYAVAPLRHLLLTAGAFGYDKGYIGTFAVAPDGRLLVQFCDSETATRQCGLGQWDGKQAKVVVPLPKESFYLDEPTLLPGTDDLYAYVYVPNRDQLIHVNLASGQTTRVADINRAFTLKGPFLAPMALSEDGKSVLIETATSPRTLSLVDLATGEQKVWSKGHAPAWFVTGSASSPPMSLPSEPWKPPVAPTPAPATPAPPQSLPMTVSVDIRRSGQAASGAQVVATINDLECASGTTDSAGRLQLSVPARTAPSDCFKPGATVKFRVNGDSVPNQVTYTPLASAQAPISLP